MKALIFDTETTGLPKNRTIKLEHQPSIIEFAAFTVNLKTGKISKKYQTLIKPAKALSDTPGFGEKKTITQITGITNEMLKDAPNFKAVSKDIIKMIEKAPVVIAHNLSFDAEMLDIEAERLKTPIRWVCKMKAMAVEDADEAGVYRGLGGLFFNHETVNHSEGEYVRDGVTTNVALSERVERGNA